MNWEYIEERWTVYQGIAEKLWSRIEPKDLALTGGDRRLLAKALKLHYGYLAAYVEEELDRFYSRCALHTDGKINAFPSGRLIAPTDPTDEYISS